MLFIRSSLFYSFLLLFLTSCSQPLLFKETRILMDTFAEISCYDSDKERSKAAIKEAFKEIERLEKLLSRFDEESEVSRINTLAGEKEIILTLEVFDLLERSVYYSKISSGGFDITVAPMKKGRYKEIVLDKDRLSLRFLSKDLKIDLGGIAKGYAVDRAKDVLESRGIENALVNIGGNIFALGRPPHKDKWYIGIRDPQNKASIIHRLTLEDMAVSTSGDYERKSHIINPASGEPIKSSMSVTVVAGSAEKADVLSTAVFVMGEEKGLEFISSLEGVEAHIFP